LNLLHIQITTGGKEPIYRQVANQLRSAIATGRLPVGEPLPSVRGLATELVVNPNTIAKAYAELVRDGLIEGRQGRGYFVAKRREIYTKRERKRRFDEAMLPFVAEALTLGYDERAILNELKQHFKTMSRA
jgi:GntR family transcriptional regulator